MQESNGFNEGIELFFKSNIHFNTAFFIDDHIDTNGISKIVKTFLLFFLIFKNEKMADRFFRRMRNPSRENDTVPARNRKVNAIPGPTERFSEFQ